MITIREAESEDLHLCAALRPVYTTRVVWQFGSDSDARLKRSSVRVIASGTTELHFSMQQVRLPRVRTLILPSATIPLVEVWESYALRLVALQDDQVCGYLLVQAMPDQHQAMIARLLVDNAVRRQGVGTSLVRTVRAWGRAHHLTALLSHVPLRNVPAVEFYQQCGFCISGLVEHFYPTREDALLLRRTP